MKGSKGEGRERDGGRAGTRKRDAGRMLNQYDAVTLILIDSNGYIKLATHTHTCTHIHTVLSLMFRLPNCSAPT